jgi:F1F0 ATPase subunit 2
MGSVITLALALLAGAALGAIFFGGLWWTIRKGLASPHAAVWLLGGFLLRTSVTLAGFYLVLQGGWKPLAACLAGFVAARIAVMRFTRVPCNAGDRSIRQEAR